MPIATEAFQDRSDITSLSVLDKKTIVYSTTYHGIRMLNLPDYKTKQKLTYDELHSSSTAFCFNDNLALMAFATNNAIHILSLQTHKLIKTIKVAKAHILELIFCENYIIAGTDRGRVLQYRYDNSAQLARLCSFKPIKKREKTNYVSALSVYENYLACSGYGGALYVFDIFSHAQRITLIESGDRINALYFLDNDTLISADIHGTIIIHSLLEPQTKKKINAPFRNIKQIVGMPNRRYITILGNENYISLIDIKEAKVAQVKYVTFATNTTRMTLVNEALLLVALSNHTVMKIELINAKELRTALIYNDVLKAYDLIESEPMLCHTREYQLLEKRFNSLYNEAAGALISQNKTLALKTLSQVKQIPSKQMMIEELFIAYEQYSRFKLIYLEKRYALAYAMAEKYPPLKLSPLFLKIEEVWLDNFKNAQRHVLMGNIGNAKVLLDDYVTIISKRDIITLLLGQDREFLRFLKAIEEKDFQILEELLHKHPNFTATPTYVSLSQKTEKIMQKIAVFINEGKLLEAKELLQKFKNSSFAKNDLKKLHHQLQHMTQLQKAYKDNDFKTCYEILDTYHHLNNSNLGILLNKHWIKLISKCEEHALKANPKGIKDTLKGLLLVQTRTGRIGDLLRVSFHSKIKAYLAKRAFSGAQNIIYSYIDIFGSDNEIKSLMTTYEALSKKRLAITQDGNGLSDRDKWISSEAIVG